MFKVEGYVHGKELQRPYVINLVRIHVVVERDGAGRVLPVDDPGKVRALDDGKLRFGIPEVAVEIQVLPVGGKRGVIKRRTGASVDPPARPQRPVDRAPLYHHDFKVSEGKILAFERVPSVSGTNLAVLVGLVATVIGQVAKRGAADTAAGAARAVKLAFGVRTRTDRSGKFATL
jgi:hypothetical protein